MGELVPPDTEWNTAQVWELWCRTRTAHLQSFAATALAVAEPAGGLKTTSSSVHWRGSLRPPQDVGTTFHRRMPHCCPPQCWGCSWLPARLGVSAAAPRAPERGGHLGDCPGNKTQDEPHVRELPGWWSCAHGRTEGTSGAQLLLNSSSIKDSVRPPWAQGPSQCPAAWSSTGPACWPWPSCLAADDPGGTRSASAWREPGEGALVRHGEDMCLDSPLAPLLETAQRQEEGPGVMEEGIGVSPAGAGPQPTAASAASADLGR